MTREEVSCAFKEALSSCQAFNEALSKTVVVTSCLLWNPTLLVEIIVKAQKDKEKLSGMIDTTVSH